MSANKFRPHLLVLPEDDANREIANGFGLRIEQNVRQFQVLSPVGGWVAVREKFRSERIPYLKSWPEAFMILIVDFDQRENRYDEMAKVVPDDMEHRVFIVGVWSEPERPRSDFGSFERLGEELAEECLTNQGRTWDHDQIRHNAEELTRMRATLRPIFFRSQ